MPSRFPELRVAWSSPTTPGPGPNLNLGSPLHTSRPRHWGLDGAGPEAMGRGPRPSPALGAREERYLGRLRATRARSNIFNKCSNNTKWVLPISQDIAGLLHCQVRRCAFKFYNGSPITQELKQSVCWKVTGETEKDQQCLC